MSEQRAHGEVADAALRYAVQFGRAASCPVRRLVLLGAPHGSLSDAPPEAWSVLSVHGTADGHVAALRAVSTTRP